MVHAVPRADVEAPRESLPEPGLWLLVWSLLGLALQLSIWLTGARDESIGVAVEAGVARTESRMTGEFDEDAIREALRLQYDTFVFWRALFGIGDLLAVPTLLVGRSLAIAATIAVAGAMTGRSPKFALSFAWAAVAQGCWLIGPLASWIASLLGNVDFDSTLRLLLVPGPIPGPVWSLAGNVDLFAAFGWLLLTFVAMGRGWAHPITLLPSLASLALFEVLFVSVVELLVQGAMRGTILP
ncbi:MAG TPA: hypothetical protein DCQ98_10835 [Planctomycetaceae bacterium]|nr:hypothetical protein [Planctomycetaceae bacterium]HRF00538.1 hypothetical protein [Pirellulaceae bacterium]